MKVTLIHQSWNGKRKNENVILFSALTKFYLLSLIVVTYVNVKTRWIEFLGHYRHCSNRCNFFLTRFLFLSQCFFVFQHKGKNHRLEINGYNMLMALILLNYLVIFEVWFFSNSMMPFFRIANRLSFLTWIGVFKIF